VSIVKRRGAPLAEPLMLELPPVLSAPALARALPEDIGRDLVEPQLAGILYQQVSQRTVRELFPGTLVAPGLVVGGTDSQHMGIVSDHIYKFSPVRAKPEDLPRFHGTNERITVANLVELIRFYHRLVSQGAGG
jgi:acetylornithine deacetylase/succinyl-diaminopimelate desuccinylase-like protein